MRLTHVSPSTLSLAARCGEALRFKVEGVREPKSFQMVRGTGVAKAIEANMIAKLRTGAGLSLDEIADVARDSVRDELDREEVRTDLGDDADGEPITPQDATATAIGDAIMLSRLHALAAAPSIIPTGVEVRVTLTSERLAVPFVGIIDLIAQDGEGEAIRDTKTKAKLPPKTEADDSDQLTAYDALFRALKGETPTRLVLDHLVLPTKTLPARYIAQSSAPREEADFAALSGRIERVVQMVDREVFIPAPEGAWWCAAKTCGHWRRCVFARGRARPAS